MNLDAAKWNGTGGELSSCVINTFIRSCIIIFGTLSEQIYQLTFVLFCFMYLYICLYVSLSIVIACIVFIQRILYLKYAIV